MNITDIHNTWGSIVSFDHPSDFFKQDVEFWRELMYKRQFIVFKSMSFAKSDYAKLCSYFGKLWSVADYMYSREKPEMVEVNGARLIISPMSNKISQRLEMKAMPWHSDIPNRKLKPFPNRSLWMVSNPNPESGLTSWLNVEKGIDLLPQELKDQITNIKIVQQSWYDKDTDIQEFDFIKYHPITGAPSLRLNFFCDQEKGITDAWIKHVKVNGELLEPGPILKPFFKFLQEQPELVYTHKWDLHDIAIYDNWPFVHSRSKLEFAPEFERKFYRANIDHLTSPEWDTYKSDRLKLIIGKTS
jgi:alpha-ketoglutarate-dependent taurine dioxygenase